MKKLLFLIPILISCSTPQTIVKAVKSVNISANDTITTIDTISITSTGITRQERKLIKDSLKHVEAIVKLENERLKDSLNMLIKDNRNLRRNQNKGNRIVRGVKKDSSNFEIQKLKQENKELKLNNEKEIDLLNAEVKKLKQEGNNEKAFLKQQGKNEKRRVVWWMWLIIIGLILSLLLNILLLLIRR